MRKASNIVLLVGAIKMEIENKALEQLEKEVEFIKTLKELEKNIESEKNEKKKQIKLVQELNDNLTEANNKKYHFTQEKISSEH